MSCSSVTAVRSMRRPARRGGLPMPQTLAGAVRTWLFGRLGGDVEVLAAAVRQGAIFGDAVASQGVRTSSRRAPRYSRSVVRQEREASCTDACDESSATSTEGCIGSIRSPRSFQVGRWRRWKGRDPCGRRGSGPAKPQAGYLCTAGLERFLKGDIPRPDEILGAEDLFVYEDRVGIGVDAKTGTAGKGMIYSVRMMRLRPGVTLAVDLVGAREDLEACCPDAEDILALGGESRRVTRSTNGRRNLARPRERRGRAGSSSC